ncbi:MAG: hypothetical protein M0002_11760 [Rhodospirillales bacterium]|nr:hypothetical protein [Rhodospirillales bacterium]
MLDEDHIPVVGEGTRYLGRPAHALEVQAGGLVEAARYAGDGLRGAP